MLVFITINGVCAGELENNTILSADSSTHEIAVTNDEKMILGDNGDYDAFQDKYNAGNTIELENNYTFSNEFEISKDVTINGNGYSIKASGENRIFTISNEAKVILNNITFLNGNPLDVGGSIYIYGTSNVEINNCVFKNNSALDGGAIYCEGSNCTITNSKFYDNVQDNPSTNVQDNPSTNYGGGGAIYLIDSNANIQNCEFINNSASIYAAAIYFEESSETVSLSVNNSIFRKNNATNSINEGNYGAIYVYGGNFLIYNSKFENNYADYGGAIGVTDCYGVIHNSTFSDNEAFYYAGAINAEAMELLISNSSFINNKIIGPYDEEADFIEDTQAGGAIVWFTNKGSIVNSKFINNQAKSGSSIIITYDCICEINGSTFSDEANSYAIYNLNSELQLNNNVLDKNNFIYNSYLISSKTFIVVLNNNTFNLNPNSKMALTARVTDDNNNTIIFSSDFDSMILLKFLINDDEIEAYCDDAGLWAAKDEYEFNQSCIVSANILFVDSPIEPLNDTGVKFASINMGKNETNPSIIMSDVIISYNSKIPFTAIFKDENGEPLKNTSVVFILLNTYHPVTTDSNGSADFLVLLDVGVYNITAVNTVTAENLTKTLTICPRITENINLTKDYLEDDYFKVLALGDDGKPAGAGEIVKITVNGVTYERITDENGYATLPIRLIPGKYPISVEYCGFSTSNVVIVKQILKTKKVKVKKSADRFKITASLKTSSGKPIVGKTIFFKFKGKKYKATTNSKGKAKIIIKKNIINKLKIGKKYKVKLRYIDDRVNTFVIVKK
ncbi:hypothetical protein [uncultured Methanobrevibacter sp.]|uniref:hypothetical protein n=1 Tax=uncultured Methanobrevibacter sp. TaxID=253161 RepID=UPI0025FC03A8|nr:hypothetical protein [uncultured Methanobrevibacter sp.]